MHRLKKENLAKNGMYRPLACVYVEILVIPHLKKMKDRSMLNLTPLPNRLAGKIKDYLIQNKKDDLLK
ncbi:MAG: hypothetical protein C5S41_01215 [Candidatus Methanomarinus sp.]|jgi:hypothetical protein|nr:MAG: hypothetical protein C5S41_01215 [ANME-2 cluster archaeon]